MARQSFFSFRYRNDNWRASIVRNSWLTQDRKASGFFDTADWEAVKRKDDATIEKWIDGQLNGTSVTVILIGQDTAGKKWINYELTASHKRGNGIIAVYIHNVRNSQKQTATKGRNPLDDWEITENGKKVSFSSLYNTYDYISDDGYNNMGSWIEKAAKDAGK